MDATVEIEMDEDACRKAASLDRDMTTTTLMAEVDCRREKEVGLPCLDHPLLDLREPWSMLTWKTISPFKRDP